MTSAGRAVLYSHGDVDVATLLFGSRDGDGEGRLDSVCLVDKLDPELVVIDCRAETRNRRVSQPADQETTSIILA